jgi:hypothetical protein
MAEESEHRNISRRSQPLDRPDRAGIFLVRVSTDACAASADKSARPRLFQD